MSKQRQIDLKTAEALGQIKTLPETPELPMVEETEEAVIDNPQDFQIAIGNAQMDGADHIEVTERLFKHLIKGAKTKYITYGNPGIKVFMKGTRDKIEREESMNAEDYANHILKNKQANAN